MNKIDKIKIDKNNSPQDINREIKTLRNWDWTDNKNPKKERSIITGQYVEIGDVKGFISRVEDNNVFIEDSIQQGKLISIPLKKFLSVYKPSKTKNDIVASLSIEGPTNTTNNNAPKVGDGFEKKIDAKSIKASDQKLSNKINTIKTIKSFSDLSKGFDSTKIKSTKKPINTKIDKVSNNHDDALLKTNTTIKYFKSFNDLSDLKQKTPTDKKIKVSDNEISKTIDNKVPKAEDNKISKKINKVKSFTELNSKIVTGPNKK